MIPTAPEAMDGMETPMTTKKFINDSVNVVEEMVQGLCLSNSDTLIRLGELHVVLHRDINSVKERQVTILSGGGSGHEPAHAGFVGDGMLSGWNKNPRRCSSLNLMLCLQALFWEESSPALLVRPYWRRSARRPGPKGCS